MNSFKYLGVFIDCNLNWKVHIQSVKSYLMMVTRKMFLLKPYCSRNILKMFYYGLVNSKLQYGITSWGGSYMNSFGSLLVAQKHIIRIMCSKTRMTHSWPLFCELRILPLRHLYVFKVLREFFEQSGNTATRNSRIYNLRVNNLALVDVPIAYKTHFTKFYLVTSPLFFNSLPMSIRVTPIFHSFLKKSKKLALYY